MTERLYYSDAYAVRFSAQVLEQLEWDGLPAVVLDRTAFYPTSGGQPADRGVLGGVHVLDVAVRETDGAIIHIVERALPLGATVEGEVDWQRRFDHMQQHSGQHILSAAFEQLLNSDTVGFHIGAETCTVDIQFPHLTLAEAERVEERTNQIIWENRPLRAHMLWPEEWMKLPLRKPPTVQGLARIVEIEGFDFSPCGGTHVSHTGEVGLLKITRLDHRGANTRVEFVCGKRALKDFRTKHTLLSRLASTMTVGLPDLECAVERMLAEIRHLRHNIQKTQQRLLAAEAQILISQAQLVGQYPVVWHVWEAREAEELRSLALTLTQQFTAVALLAGITERAHLCFVCSDAIDLDMTTLLREICMELGGKGGGQAHIAQGSAPTRDKQQISEALARLVSKLQLTT